MSGKALRTVEEIRAAGRAAGRRLGPLTQQQADLVAMILADAARQQQAAQPARKAS